MTYPSDIRKVAARVIRCNEFWNLMQTLKRILKSEKRSQEVTLSTSAFVWFLILGLELNEWENDILWRLRRHKWELNQPASSSLSSSPLRSAIFMSRASITSISCDSNCFFVASNLAWNHTNTEDVSFIRIRIFEMWNYDLNSFWVCACACRSFMSFSRWSLSEVSVSSNCDADSLVLLSSASSASKSAIWTKAQTHSE